MNGGRVEVAAPAVLEVEQRLLASFFIGGRAALALADPMTPDRFSAVHHQAIFAAICELDADGIEIDLTTVRAHLERSGRLEAAGGGAYVCGLLDPAPDISNVEGYARMLREAATRRHGDRLADAMKRAFRNGRPAAETLATFREKIEVLEREADTGRASSASPLTVPEALTEARPEHEWYVRDFLSRSALLYFSSYAYLGKTTVVINAFLHLARGLPFLGYEIPRPVKVLYWLGEGNRALFLERVKVAAYHMGIDLAALPFFVPPPDFLAPFTSNDFARFVIENGFSVVACDTAGYFHDGDENSATDFKRYIVKPLKAIGRETGASFVLTTHYGKPAENRTGKHLTRGTSAILGDCDTILRLEAPNGERADARTLIFDKVKDAPERPDIPLRFDKMKALILPGELVPEAAPSRAETKAAARAEGDRKAKEDAGLLFRRSPGGLTADELRTSFGRRREWAAAVIGELHAHGYIRSEPADRLDSRNRKFRVPVWKWVTGAGETT